MKPVHIAIVGATGLVGRTFLKVIEETNIAFDTLRLFASASSLGKKITVHQHDYTVDTIKPGAFRGIDFALFSAGASVAKQYASQAVQEGAIVIDNSSAFRMQDGIPLVVPEVNMEEAINQPLIANPNCSTIQSVLPLSLLQKAFGLEKVVYTTYQAVSGSGYKGLQALEGDWEGVYPYDIRETCIPEIDVFMDDGYTKEEHKMIEETRKILGLPDLLVSATCIRVPVKIGHGVVIRVTLKQAADIMDVRKALIHPSVVILDQPKEHIYPTSTVAKGTDLVYVGRLRKDLSETHTFLFYVVADNVRKGAASNAVEIMKGLMDHA